MNEPLYMQKEHRTANEPKVHPLVRNSFVFVRSAGMRLAPEILVLELMREVFFKVHYESKTARDIEPDNPNSNFSLNERAVLHSLRGRRKKARNSAIQSFFAPAYPSLARTAWLAPSRERAILNFLLAGPIAHDLWRRGPDARDGKSRQQEVASILEAALLGKRLPSQDSKSVDLLAATIGVDSLALAENPDLPRQNIEEKTKYSPSLFRIPDDKNDELAFSITRDLLSICQVEGKIPRMQWVHLLMTFLRFALPMWLLAHMRMTKLLHGWLLEAVDHGKLKKENEIVHAVRKRNRSLLHPTLVATRELIEHIESYMKCRIEINMLLYWLQQVRPEEVKDKSSLSLGLSGVGSNVLTIENLLNMTRSAANDIRASERFKNVAEGLNFRNFLTREGEQFSAWRLPLMRGQGKNIDEFFRVLYKAQQGDEQGGYLLTPEGSGARRAFRVFPGQLLLKTATYLASKSKQTGQLRGGAGKLVLGDVEDLFGEYGVDFSASADARPLLMKELQALGLLTGSPDAGSSVAVACPY